MDIKLLQGVKLEVKQEVYEPVIIKEEVEESNANEDENQKNYYEGRAEAWPIESDDGSQQVVPSNGYGEQNGDSDGYNSPVSGNSDEDISDSDNDLDGYIEPEDSEGWNIITNPIADERPEDLPSLEREFCGVNPEIELVTDIYSAPFFKLFITKEVALYLCDCVNDKAEEYLSSKPMLNGRINKLMWSNVDIDEMYTFLALFMYTGLVQNIDIKCYWSRTFKQPGVYFYCPEVMSKDRYLAIMRFFRFSRVAESSKNDPASRLEPFCEMLRQKCQYMLDAGSDIVISDALVLWKGGLGFRQFIKARRVHRGVKLCVMCPTDSIFSGYSWNFFIYYGKNTFQLPFPVPFNMNISEQIVVYLLQNVLDQGRHIIVDNGFSSLRLVRYLDSRRTTMTAAIHPYRGLPKEIFEKGLEKLNYIFVRKHNALLVRWLDKKDITIITTEFTSGMVEKKKAVVGGHTKYYSKPFHIAKYNELMGSTDKTDKYLETCSPCRKSMVWFKKLGFHIIMRMVLNSYLIYKDRSQDRKLRFSDFVTEVVMELLETHTNGGFFRAKMEFKENKEKNSQNVAKRKKTQKRSEEREPVGHFLLPIPPTGSKKNPQKRCRVCYKETKTMTRNGCAGCPGFPGLCTAEHFEEWHASQPSTSAVQN